MVRRNKPDKGGINTLKFFEQVANENKPLKDHEWLVSNTREEVLGVISYSAKWREFIFNPMDDMVFFSAGCLDEISTFLKELNEQKKIEQKVKKMNKQVKK